jgi:hypothetical protein
VSTRARTALTLAWLAAAVVATPGHAQSAAPSATRVRPYVSAEVGVGVSSLDCGGFCGYATSGVSRAVGVGFAFGSVLRVGGEFTRYDDVLGWTPNSGHAQAALLVASVAPLARDAPRLELRIAVGLARLDHTDRNVGRLTVDTHAPVYRVGLGYAVGGGHWRFVPALDLLRTYRRRPADYRTSRLDVGMRWQP